MRLIRYVANIAIALVLGDLLARQIADMVYTGNGIASLRRLLISAGFLKPDSQYDISGMLLLLILVMSIAFVGVVVWLINIGVRLYRNQRTV